MLFRQESSVNESTCVIILIHSSYEDQFYSHIGLGDSDSGSIVAFNRGFDRKYTSSENIAVLHRFPLCVLVVGTERPMIFGQSFN